MKQIFSRLSVVKKLWTKFRDDLRAQVGEIREEQRKGTKWMRRLVVTTVGAIITMGGSAMAILADKGEADAPPATSVHEHTEAEK